MKGPPKTAAEARRRWSSGEGYRFRQVLERLVCEECGFVADGTREIHCHHIKDKATNPELTFVRSNILIICEVCHLLEHDRFS